MTPVETHLEGRPGEWAFDREVADAFDDMLERSIPQYRVMRELVVDLGLPFVTDGSEIVDLGCSRGEALAPFVARRGAYNRYLGIEVSEPMREAALARFRAYPNVRIVDADLRRDWTVYTSGPSLVLSVLTLMFVPINYRAKILDEIVRTLAPGGALILVEKVLGETATTDALIQDRYHRMKAENGYSREEIVRKAAALEGVQVPVTASWNEDALRKAGFRTIECFWRWCNFAAWVAIREG